MTRFIFSCKNIAEKCKEAEPVICSADIVTAVYYYRRYPNVNEFINNFFRSTQNYFQLQWLRSTWTTFSKMSEAELSDIVINQIMLVANSEEEQ